MRFPHQLHANYKIHPCTLEDVFYAAAFKESPRFHWISKWSSTPFTKLKRFPEIPVPNREEH